MVTWSNWARTATCAPRAVHHPASEDDVVALLAGAEAAGERVTVAGSGHSFTALACTDGWQVRLDRLAEVVAVDAGRGTATVQAGITLARLNDALAAHGVALANLGDVAYQTVAGAIATATHGTGARFGNLSSQVRELRLVTACGDVVECSPESNADVFSAARVSLGALGIVTEVTLSVVPAFRLHAVEEPADLDDVLDTLDARVDAADHFELYWFPHTGTALTKTNRRTAEPARPQSRVAEYVDQILIQNRLFGAACALGRARPAWVPAIARASAKLIGRTERIDRSDRVFASPRLVRFSEMEYAIPREHAADALRRVRAMIDDRNLRVGFPLEVRFVAADDAWLSPAYGRDTAYIAAHLAAGVPYETYFRAVEEIMLGYGGRPHWGKIHYRTASDLRAAYPMWDRFQDVRRRLDPAGRFRNAELDRVLGA